MRKNRLLIEAHAILASLISKNDVVVDATMGQGHDTYFLSKIAKEVYAFDIQETALEKTKALTKDQSNVHLIHDSHEHMFSYMDDAKGYIFNLGYLPTADKTITTHAHTTINTLNQIILRLKKDDFIQMIVYRGHQEGMIEHEAINDWLKSLNKRAYQVLMTSFYDDHKYPPYMIMIYKSL